ncbi:MAG: universal stress protein [Nitrospirota bacterium]
MKKVLIAADDTKDSKAVLSAFYNLAGSPEEVILLHVERLEGCSLMIDMLGDAEMSTLKESLKGTEHKEELDRRANKILDYYKKELENTSQASVKTIMREGIPAEEILRVSEEEDVDLIIMGNSLKKGLNRLITGSVAKDVERNAKVPVLVAKTESNIGVGVGSFFFVLFVAIGIYWSSVVLMDLAERLLTASDEPSLLVYISISAGIMFAGIILGISGAFLGWLLGNIIEEGIKRVKNYQNLFELLK